MQRPYSHRRNIPLYCHKSDQDYQRDPYERFDPMVVRQSLLHLADDLWNGYPMQAILDFATPYYESSLKRVVEVGCGVGRWIGSVAQQFPHASCWGMDYSYQMLKRAQEYWIAGKTIVIDGSNKGYPLQQVQGHVLSNLQLGLAQAHALPFADNSQDLVLSSFLLDRLTEPLQGLAEWQRILRPDGRLILISPLNFERTMHWEQCYPPSKLQTYLQQSGWDILHWEEALCIQEPLDRHGNCITWHCLGFVLCKRNSSF